MASPTNSVCCYPLMTCQNLTAQRLLNFRYPSCYAVVYIWQKMYKRLAASCLRVALKRWRSLMYGERLVDESLFSIRYVDNRFLQQIY
jgi:hypothetical protein